MARREKKPVHHVQMTEGKRAIIQQLLQEYEIESAQDIQEALKDLLGGTLKEMLEAEGYAVIETLLLADEQQPLERQLRRLADQRQVNVIFTTGGTGFSRRDITPEATQAVCDRMADGITQAVRQNSLAITGRAMFSRAVSGIRGQTLIINLPGSPKAVKESLEYLLEHLGHGLGILRGTDGECGEA